MYTHKCYFTIRSLSNIVNIIFIYLNFKHIYIYCNCKVTLYFSTCDLSSEYLFTINIWTWTKCKNNDLAIFLFDEWFKMEFIAIKCVINSKRSIQLYPSIIFPYLNILSFVNFFYNDIHILICFWPNYNWLELEKCFVRKTSS